MKIGFVKFSPDFFFDSISGIEPANDEPIMILCECDLFDDVNEGPYPTYELVIQRSSEKVVAVVKL